MTYKKEVLGLFDRLTDFPNKNHKRINIISGIFFNLRIVKMDPKKILFLFFLVGIVSITIFFVGNNLFPVSVTGDSTRQPDHSIQTYKSENISIVLNPTLGSFIINATVSEYPSSVPVYRINTSNHYRITFERRNVIFPVYLDDIANRTWIMNSLPEEKDAPVLAEKALQQFGGLPPDASVFILDKNAGVDVSLSVTSVSLMYKRIIKGMPVEGWTTLQHDLIRVHLGPGGDLIAVFKNWAGLDFVKESPIIPIQEALKKVENGELVNYHGSSPIIKINAINLGYYEDTEITPILEPVWIFHGTDIWNNNETIYVYASNNGSVSSDIENKTGISSPPGTANDSYFTLYQQNFKDRKKVTSEEAIQNVKKFSQAPDLMVKDYSLIVKKSGCGFNYSEFNITTNEGIYWVNPRNGQIVSVFYNPSRNGSLIKPLQLSQAMNISGTYIYKKFGDYPPDYLSQNMRGTEDLDFFTLGFPVSDTTVHISINKQTGQITRYYNENALEPWLC